MTEPKTPQSFPRSLSTEAARNLATTTKSPPQMQGITPRWLLRMLPWVRAAGGVYRVNRRLSYAVGDGRLSFINTGAKVSVIPQELAELPLLHGFNDEAVLTSLAGRFSQREFAAGELLAEVGKPADQVFLLAHGKAQKLGQGKYGEETELGLLTDGDHFGDANLIDGSGTWSFGVRAVTRVIALTMAESQWKEVVAQSAALAAHVASFKERRQKPQDKHGQAEIAMSAGHEGEVALPTTFVDYELNPREYELSVAQTVLRVHSRVADLYNEPMNQTEQQLRLTIEALRERQEHELVNNPEFGLLHNADLAQRIPTRAGAPTPDDLDDLLCRRRGTRFFLAHPKAIAAFGRECTKRAIYPQIKRIENTPVIAWRGVPIFPCDKLPISSRGTTSILVMRTGAEEQGVIGLHLPGIPDEVEPSLSVRFMGVDEKAVLSYLVTAYYSAAVLVPDALGVLEDVAVG